MESERDVKRQREESLATATADILGALKRVDNLFIELNEGLNYAEDASAFDRLVENQDFADLHSHLKAMADRSETTRVLQVALRQESQKLAAMWDSTSNRRVAKKLRTAFLLRSAFFHASLQEVSPGRSDMRYYAALPNLEHPEKLSSVILRREDKSAWDFCLETSRTSKVCCVGVPGIGKSTTTFYLLRKIVMEERRTLVYAVQAEPPKATIYMKFVPVVDDDVVGIDVSCVASNLAPEDALEWNYGDYYVVDPGKTKSSCDVDFDEKVHVVIVCSADDRHWGANEFKKRRHRVDDDDYVNGGTFVYYSAWELQDLLDGKHLLNMQDLSETTICARYRVVGGSVRKIIDFTTEEAQREDISNALAPLLERTMRELAGGTCFNAFNPLAPGSALVSIKPRENDLTRYRLVMTSEVAEEVIAEACLKESWFAVLDENNSGNRGNLFEAFVRNKLARAGTLKMDRRSSPDAPKGSRSKTKKNYVRTRARYQLPTRSIIRVANLAESVREASSDDTMFYSRDESEPLIDMICRFENGFLAIQATIQRRHDAETAKIIKLVEDLNLQQGEKLVIVYAVPQSRLAEFETTPVNPLLGRRDLGQKVEIYHLGIKDEEKKAKKHNA